MKISRFWNAASWLALAFTFLAPIVGFAWGSLKHGWPTGPLELNSTGVRLIAIMAGLGVLATLACIDQFRRYLDERALGLAQTNFVAAISHELRTPLTTIKLYTEMLRHGALPADQQAEFLEGIQSESDRLARLVEDVLAYSASHEGRLRLAKAPHEARALVEEALVATRPGLIAAGLHIDVDVPDGLVLHVDRDAIVRALVNLLANAEKYAATGGRVQIEVRAETRRAAITVRDFGPGIPRAEREKVFRAFYRPGNELTRERTGTGLGLALVRAAARAHGGRVKLASPAGAGAAFRIELPAGSAAS